MKQCGSYYVSDTNWVFEMFVGLNILEVNLMWGALGDPVRAAIDNL